MENKKYKVKNFFQQSRLTIFESGEAPSHAFPFATTEQMQKDRVRRGVRER